MTSMTHDKNDAQFLDQCPLERVLVASVSRVVGGRFGVAQCDGAALLLNKGIGDEVVNDGRVDWRIGARPDDDTRGGQDLERVQHPVSL